MRRFLLLIGTAWAIAAAMPASAAGDRCVVVVPQQGNEALYNGCDQCRMITVSRARSAGGVQGQRSYAVPARTRVDLTFATPGKTRILTDRPCGVEKPDAPYPDAVPSDPTRPGDARAQCVRLTMMKGGKPALVNSCPACREVDLVYEIRKFGQKRETNSVSPSAIAVLNPHPEATDVYILGDRACPKR